MVVNIIINKKNSILTQGNSPPTLSHILLSGLQGLRDLSREESEDADDAIEVKAVYKPSIDEELLPVTGDSPHYKLVFSSVLSLLVDLYIPPIASFAMFP